MNLRSDKYNRQVRLLCPTCGSDQFAHEGEDGQAGELVTCVSCGLELSKDDLIRANRENVDEHVKEIGKEVAKDLQRELHESLKRAFRGNKNIKVR